MNKRAISTICIFLAIAIVALVVLMFLFVNCEPDSPDVPEGISKGYKAKLQTVFLVVGIDNDGVIKDSKSYKNTEQADFIALVAVNSLDNEYQVLQINRDSMVQIKERGIDGVYTGNTYDGQIALAYTYGHGLQDSCKYLMQTVREWLYGITIDYYAVMTMKGIAILNDYISDNQGIPVTLDKDYLDFDESYIKGTTVNLVGDKCLEFIRARMTVEDGTNISRMNRHRLYMNSFTDYVKTLTITEDFISKGYDKLQSEEGDYLITNANTSVLTKFFDGFNNYKNKGIVTFEGEAKYNEYAEFHVNPDSLNSVVLDMFFKKK